MFALSLNGFKYCDLSLIILFNEWFEVLLSNTNSILISIIWLHTVGMVSNIAISAQMTRSLHLLAPLISNRVEYLFVTRAIWRMPPGQSCRCYGLTWPADWSFQASPTTRLAPKWSVVNPATTSVVGSPGYCRKILRVTIHGQQLVL